jgi:hypothetical protein
MKTIIKIYNWIINFFKIIFVFINKWNQIDPLKMKEILLKEYFEPIKSFRRFLADRFRRRVGKIFTQDPMFYWMLLLALTSALLTFLFDGWWTGLPMGLGVLAIALTWIYFHFYPLSWGEMYDYEKIRFREIWGFDKTWEPTDLK